MLQKCSHAIRLSRKFCYIVINDDQELMISCWFSWKKLHTLVFPFIDVCRLSYFLNCFPANEAVSQLVLNRIAGTEVMTCLRMIAGENRWDVWSPNHRDGNWWCPSNLEMQCSDVCCVWFKYYIACSNWCELLIFFSFFLYHLSFPPCFTKSLCG